jgi:glycogen(starch) synthase
MRRLAERGHDVAVLTTTTRFPGVSEMEMPFTVERVLEWYWDDHVLASPRPLARLAMERRNHRRLRGALRAHRPEVVSVWNTGAMSHGLLRSVSDAGLPIVYAVCDEWPVYGRSLDAWGRMFELRPRLARLAERLLRIPCEPVDLGPTGAWCFVSEHTRAACRATSPFSFPISGIVHSGIDASDFPVSDAALGDDGRHRDAFDWRLLYVGRLDERKGVLTAVEALSHLPAEATITFVGRGPAADAIGRRAAALGLADRVEVTAVDRSELADVYRSASAFLFTSEWDEPFGLTPIEAMACGTPVVATATGGSGEFLRHEVNCLRYPPGDVGALAGSLQRLAADRGLRQKLVSGGRALAAAVTTDQLADTFERWHVDAAAGFPQGPPPDHVLPVLQ